MAPAEYPLAAAEYSSTGAVYSNTGAGYSAAAAEYFRVADGFPETVGTYLRAVAGLSATAWGFWREEPRVIKKSLNYCPE